MDMANRQSFAHHRGLDVMGAFSMDTRLEQILDARGLNQSQLAARIGVPATQINRLINGNRRWTLDWLQKIARALDLQASDLLPDQDFRNRLAADELRLLDDYRALRPTDRLRYLRISAALADRPDDDQPLFDALAEQGPAA